MNSGRLLIKTCVFSLGVPIGSCREYQCFISEGKDNHAIELIFERRLDAPDLVRLIVSNRIELLYFQTLLDNTKIAVIRS